LKTSQDEYKTAVNDENFSKAKRIRDDAIEDAIAVIDTNFTDFTNKLDTRRSTTDFLADVIELGAGAATGISKGERPNQILGISLTAFRGVRRSSELNFYRQQTTPILIAKMEDNRSRQYAGILIKKARGIDEYSLKEAIKDIVAYYNAGTLIRAFTELTKDTAAKAKESERVVRELKGENVEISDIPTIQREDLSDAIFAQRRSLNQQLQDVQDIPIPPTATGAERAAIENTKAERLKLIRLKLEAIWNEVENEDKFAKAVNEMKTEDRFVDILANRQNAPAKVTEDEYLRLINRLTAKIKEDIELNKEFLAILRKANK